MTTASRRTDRFDPALWDAIHDGADAGPASYVFRRGLELARDACRERLRAGARWLDVGCGAGHLTATLAAQACAIGADHDPRMVRRARRRFAAGQAPCPAFVVARAEALPLPDASVDGVVAVSLLGCLHELAPFLDEARRVLRAEGAFVVTVTSASSLLRRCERVLALVWPRTRVAGDCIRPYGLREIARALDAAGFELQHVHGYGFHLQLGRTLLPGVALSRALERVAAHALGRRVARNLLLVARRR